MRMDLGALHHGMQCDLLHSAIRRGNAIDGDGPRTTAKGKGPMSETKKIGGPDTIFRTPMESPSDFAFDAKVASVFDDMVDRSVPFYAEIQRMTNEMVRDFAVAGTNVYDLGCSTGTTLLGVDRAVDAPVRLVGVDNSAEMLAKCEEKLKQHGLRHEHQLVHADLNDRVTIENASVVLMVLTLQFVRPLHREALVRSAFEGLNQQGCLILVEKVLGENSTFNRLFIDYYYRMKKKNGYTELEIAQKREALENVLIPYRLMENRELLQRVGFSCTDVFFKWYNFCGMIAVK